MIAPVKDGEVTRDPVLEERYDRIAAMAKVDVERDLGLRTLTGDVSDMQSEYEEAYTSYLVEALAALETN
jgi:hypothetical protein